MVLTSRSPFGSAGSVFSLLGAEERERLKRATDLAKQMAQGQLTSGTSLLPTPSASSVPSEGLPTPSASSVPSEGLQGLASGTGKPKFSIESEHVYNIMCMHTEQYGTVNNEIVKITVASSPVNVARGKVDFPNIGGAKVWSRGA